MCCNTYLHSETSGFLQELDWRTEMKALTGIKVWEGNGRGSTEIGWLESNHSFSFGQFVDPLRSGFRSLRVINDDLIKPGSGFGTHPHQDMEILTWVLDGKIVHQDSMGTRGEIVPGDLQLMSAGTGLRHSEMNGHKDATTRFLQIWIEPEASGLSPEYQQKSFDASGRADRWQLIASPDARDGSLKVHQDAFVSVIKLSEGATVEAEITEGRHGYLHVTQGRVLIGERECVGGDAVSFTGEEAIEIFASEDSELLFFDLA